MLAFVATGSYYTRSDERSAFPLFSFFFSFFFSFGGRKKKRQRSSSLFLGGVGCRWISPPLFFYTLDCYWIMHTAPTYTHTCNTLGKSSSQERTFPFLYLCIQIAAFHLLWTWTGPFIFVFVSTLHTQRAASFIFFVRRLLFRWIRKSVFF